MLSVAVVGGVVACISFVYRKYTFIKKRLTQFMIFQGSIGLILCVVGINGIIQAFLTIDNIDFYWNLLLVLSMTEIIVSFLLMYSLFSIVFLEKNKNDKEMGQQFRAVLGKFQFCFGFVLCGMGMLAMVL